MFEWLAQKSENSRVYMCSKELGWGLQKANSLDRSTILAIAQYFRLVVFNDDRNVFAMIDQPFNYSRSELMGLYSMLETLRNGASHQLAQVQKSSQQMGVKLPEYLEEQAQWSSRALEIWMVTIGAGILPNGRERVGEMWSLLHASAALAEQAIARLHANDVRASQVTGEPAESFGEIPAPLWLRECRYVPAAFERAASGQC